MPKQNVYQEKAATTTAPEPKPKKKKSPLKKQVTEFGENDKCFKNVQLVKKEVSDASDKPEVFEAVKLLHIPKSEKTSPKSAKSGSSAPKVSPRMDRLAIPGQQLQTATALSQINANSPSFKPTKQLSAAAPTQSELTESNAANPLPLVRENSLQHMAHNLKKVKSFNPNTAGFQSFPKENKAYGGADEPESIQDNSSQYENRKRSNKYKKEADGHLQDTEVDQVVNQGNEKKWYYEEAQEKQTKPPS